MVRTERDEERDDRIEMEVLVDAYSRDEQAMGWRIYLQESMDFPFDARCIDERDVSPLADGETVRVVGLPHMEPSLKQQFVTVEWCGSELGVPLTQLEPVGAGHETEQAVADWHYWIDR